MDRIYIDRYTGKIEKTDVYLVSVTLKDGTVIEDLEPRRLFPISNKDMYISLLDKNEKEICFVRDLAELDDYDLFCLIGKKRGFLVGGGEINTERTANTLLDEFRAAKIGRITLDGIFIKNRDGESENA